MKKALIMLSLIFIQACTPINDTAFLCTAFKNANTNEEISTVYENGLCVITAGSPDYIYMVHCVKGIRRYVDFMFRVNESIEEEKFDSMIALNCEVGRLK